MAEGQGRSSEQGVKLLYIRDYLRKYTDIDHPKNANDIVQYLASKGIKASRKTIYNDILRLQMDFQEPIDYNPKKWGYYITQPQFETKELRMLIDCLQLSSLITEKESHALIEKILGLGTVYSKDGLEKYVNKRIAINKPESSVFSNVEIIRKAVSLNKKIRFRFVYPTLAQEKNDDSNNFFVISPKEIQNRNGYYYLVAYPDERYDCNYGISIERMTDIKILSIDSERSVVQKTERSEYQPPIVERDQYSFDPKREFAVTILFSKADMKLVKRRFGNDIPLVPYDDDNMMVTVHTQLSRAFFSTIVDFGEHAKILSPKEAVGEFFIFIENGVKEIEELYGYGRPDFLNDIPTNYDEMRAQKHQFKHPKRIRKPKR